MVIETVYKVKEKFHLNVNVKQINNFTLKKIFFYIKIRRQQAYGVVIEKLRQGKPLPL